MEFEEFEDLVLEALDGLPQEFLDHLENVEVIAKEWPSPTELAEVGLSPSDRMNLLGLYHGVPKTRRGAFYMAMPDRISIYKGPIEAHVGSNPDSIKEQVRRTVIHEVAHYYGISDERLRELGW